MRRIFFLSLLLVLIVLCSNSSSAVDGIAISPGCVPNDCSSKNLTVESISYEEVTVYNFEDNTVEFNMYVDGPSKEFVSLFPAKFNLSTRKTGACTPENGCQKINITINLTDANLSQYSWYIVASSSIKGQGMLSVNQEVAAMLRVNVAPKPLFSYKLKVAISNFFSDIGAAVKKFYKNNRWLDIVLTLVTILIIYFVVQYVRMQKKRTKSWWEIIIVKIKSNFIYLIFDYGEDKIRFSEIFNEPALLQALKDEMKKSIPKAMMLPKTSETKTDEFKEFIEKKKISIYYVLKHDEDVKKVESSIKQKFNKEKFDDIDEAQDDLNKYVKILNKTKIPEMLKRKKDKLDKKEQNE